MKKVMLAFATFLMVSVATVGLPSQSYADEISVMFQPDGAAATKPYGIRLADDDDGAVVMSIRDTNKNKRKLLKKIEEIVKNGITGSIKAIFSWEMGNIPDRRRRHTLREQVILNGEFAEDGRYYLVGHTHQGVVIRWYLPSSN